MEEYITIGYTKKTFGVKGGLKVHIEPQFFEVLIKTHVLFLNINNKPTPFFIEGIEETNAIVLYFEDVNSKEEAHPYCAKEILLRAEDLKDVPLEVPASESGYQQYVGFQIIAKGVGEIGKIEEIAVLPEQHLAIITYKGKEVLIPLNEQFIQSVDTNKKQLQLSLPEGLLEL